MTNLMSVVLNNTINNLDFFNFPSGSGSWNISDDYKDNASLLKKEERFELLNSNFSLWNNKNDCSNEILHIKQRIIIDKFISLKNIKKMFRTLRLVDKNIFIVDEEIKLFENLLDLILTTNFIENINCKYLPKKLEVLELYANQLKDLEFCSSKYTPHLKHLGVGANKIPSIDNFMDYNLKYSLVSLDLGGNKLSNLSKTLQTILKFPNLKNLILAGNPLSLFAVYRAYVIDSLKSLINLDDIPITADERFNVKGMENISESFKELCKFKINVESISKIPEREVPENVSEEPIIKRNYFVKYWFPFQSSQLLKQNKNQIGNDKKETMDNNYIEDVMYLLESEYLPKTNDEIMFKFFQDFEIKSVSCLSDFLNEKLRIEVIEETKYLYSPDNLPPKSPQIDSQNNKLRNQKSSSKQPTNDLPKHKENVKKKKIDESKMIVHCRTRQKLTVFMVDLSDFKTGATIYDKILKSDVIKQNVDTKTNDNVKKANDKDSKGKRGSAKGDHKKIMENNVTKEKETIKSPMDQIIDCHLIVNILTINNTISMETNSNL